MGRVTGLWVYQSLGDLPDPVAVSRLAARHGMRWVTVEALVRGELTNRAWLRAMRRATRDRDLRLGVHGYLGRPEPRPSAEAQAMSDAFALADADFVIVNAEIEYERSTGTPSKDFVRAYRRLQPETRSYFSSFGRPSLHGNLDFGAFAAGGFRGMPQAYENLNPRELSPRQCVADWARFFPRETMRPTLGCFTEHGKPHLPLSRLAASVKEVEDLPFNVYRQGTATEAEFKTLAALT